LSPPVAPIGAPVSVDELECGRDIARARLRLLVVVDAQLEVGETHTAILRAPCQGIDKKERNIVSAIFDLAREPCRRLHIRPR